MSSFVAAITTLDGAVKRVVVTARRRDVRFHVQDGERSFIAPFKVTEPVPVEQGPDLIERVRRYVEAQMPNACGECRQCCKTLYINEDGLTKPSHTWCGNCTKTGCGIYERRPNPCREFRCSWLKSQLTAEPMSAELRPDRCGVIFTADTSPAIGEPFNPRLIEVHRDRDAPDSDHVKAFMQAQGARGMTFKKIGYYHGEH